MYEKDGNLLETVPGKLKRFVFQFSSSGEMEVGFYSPQQRF